MNTYMPVYIHLYVFREIYRGGVQLPHNTIICTMRLRHGMYTVYKCM